MFHSRSSANFAFDVTTPMKYTTAPFPHRVRLRFVSSTTAHQVTTVYADRCRVTFSTLRPLEINGTVLIAVFGGVLKIH